MRLWTALVKWWRSQNFRPLLRHLRLTWRPRPAWGDAIAATALAIRHLRLTWRPRPARRSALTQTTRPEPVERAVPGYACFLTTCCYAVSAMRDDSWPGNVRRLSREGLQLVLRRRFEPGTFLRFDLENPSQTYSRTFFARVMKTRTEGGGEWSLECSLSPECDEDDILALIS